MREPARVTAYPLQSPIESLFYELQGGPQPQRAACSLRREFCVCVKRKMREGEGEGEERRRERERHKGTGRDKRDHIKRGEKERKRSTELQGEIKRIKGR